MRPPPRRGSKPARSRFKKINHPLGAPSFSPYQPQTAPLRPGGHIRPIPVLRAARETFHLLLITTTILCSYGHNGARRIRFQNRRQHHLFATRCLYQLDAQKLTLADAHGPCLLRHRAHGSSVRPLRYRQIRRRGHEVFAPAIRCHDRSRDRHL